MEARTFALELGEKKLILKIQNLAEQANGSVLLCCGETSVLATCVMSKQEREDFEFFPLTVNYEERFYAAGKIRGPRYIRRESRPSDEAILTSRLIDRAIRPGFPLEFKKEVQVIITVLSWDGENDSDILGLLAASLALSISDIPWAGPIAAVRVGQTNNNFILNPTYEERKESNFDLIFAGQEDKGGFLINMIEGAFGEVEENLILKSLEFSQKYLKTLITFQEKIVKEIGKEKYIIKKSIILDIETEKTIKNFLGERLEAALFQEKKTERMRQVNELKEELVCFIEKKYPGIEKTKYAMELFEKEIKNLLQKNILEKEKRPDARKIDEIREISCEAGLLPRTHGSALFCRGATKSLSILTLGAPGDHQILEGMEIVGKKRFMHHYNFPPYSVGEIKQMRGPARRDIGHGMLAEKALLPLIPCFDEFPYTIRIVSEILSSNGSTSMAAISSSCLALMDAGVPIKSPAAGIAIGLISDKKSKNYKILADIQGPEDHHGEMDLKIAGTKQGITVIQMDVKNNGITKEILGDSLSLGKKARLQILDKMEKILQRPRPQLSPYAPRILIIQINPEKIKDIIGPGGKIINKIIKECDVSIDVEDSGKIFISGQGQKEESIKKAVDWIKNITREVKVGEIFQGKVKKILDFGAFVEILPGQDGLIHISELAPFRVEKVEDVIKINDVVPVKVISIDEQGKISLSLKQVGQNFKKA